MSNEPAVFIGNDEVADYPCQAAHRLDGGAVMLNFEQALAMRSFTILGIRWVWTA